jgi:predicted DNA-binding transcriptional regulator AlpA
MPDQPLSATVLIRKAEVLRRIGGVDQATLWRWIKAGQFPEPVVVNPDAGRQMVAWREHEVEAWIAARPRGLAAPPKIQRRRQGAATTRRRVVIKRPG